MPKPKQTVESMEFGERLSALLAQAGQDRWGAGSYLAQRYGVRTVTANAWLNGEYRPTTDRAKKIAEDHGSTFEYLYFGKGSKISPSDATTAHSPTPRLRRIRIEGAQKMNEQGFWEQGDRNAEETAFPTDDPNAYAIRIVGSAFQPVVASGQCVMVSPNTELKPGRPALVILMDGRRTLRTFQSHERGEWTFTKLNDGNDYRTWPDDEIAAVERVMAYLWTE